MTIDPQPVTFRIRASDVVVEWELSATVPLPAQASVVLPAALAAGEAVTEICAPTVGAFYHASAPGEAPFVAVGDRIRRGQQVGVLEAMKLMIPIEADCDGQVAAVLVADGAQVEYGAPLIAIVPLAAPLNPEVTMFDSVLIANRGEIALRIARTCRDLGIRVIAVYSTEDRDSPVVRLADQAICIGPPAAADSYLNLPAILEAARQSGAQAVHPGYGFLSEVPDFAETCAVAGHTFVGPPAAVIEQLGDKSAARAAMAKAGLHMLAGSIEPVPDAEAAAKVAADIGYPVIIKAVAGGGGRGMQVVHCPDELPSTFASVRATAQSLFKDDRVYVEQYLPAARHVEVQVLCDSYGAGVHIGQRDCSVQRRRQKIIEEAPAPELPAELATRMGKAALRGVLAAGYVGAGTVEFLVDASGRFYFMEVNCRIQVEHPVTELVYGIDLIREQLRIAAGEPLGYGQADLVPRGVALECRLNAEDPARGFMPTPGVLTDCAMPAGAFVRVDTDKTAGDRISAAYDPLLAKIAVWAPDRTQALARMRRALAETRVAGAGICTNRDLLHAVLDHPAFVAGTHDTSLLGDLVSA